MKKPTKTAQINQQKSKGEARKSGKFKFKLFEKRREIQIFRALPRPCWPSRICMTDPLRGCLNSTPHTFTSTGCNQQKHTAEASTYQTTPVG